MTSELLNALIATFRKETEDLVSALQNRLYLKHDAPYVDEGTTYTETGVSYASEEEVLSTIPEGLRYTGLTVKILDDEYWFLDDGSLVLKTKAKFTYIAFASDATGTDFTLVNDTDLPYMAILVSSVEIPEPLVTDFEGLWRSGGGVDSAPNTLSSSTTNEDDGSLHTHEIETEELVGATGSFTTTDSTVTVENGIITAITSLV